jgi:hypothetical protein
MKLRSPRRSNPFENALVDLFLHAAAFLVMVASICLALARGTWTPIAIGLSLIVAGEMIWMYFRLRR